MSDSDNAKGARGAGVTLIGQFVKIGINASSVIVLSHLLSPESFGLVTMVAVVVTLGELFRDLGLSTSALRAPELSHQQASNLFWMNSALGLASGLLVAASTPIVVLIYRQPELAAITPVIAISLLFNGIQAQIQVHMARAQQYTALIVTDLGARLFGLGLAIVAALSGLDYWSLVVQAVSQALFLLLSRAVLVKWVPSLPRRGAKTKTLVVSGVDFGVAAFLQFLANNVDVLMIGAIRGVAPLGLYNRAMQLLTMPVGQMLGPLVNVVVPTLNQVKKSGGSVQKHLLRLQPLAGMASTWVFSMAVASAPVLIPLVLGNEWTGSVLLFRILAVGGVGQGFYQIAYWAFLVEGSSREMLKFQLVSKGLTVVLVVIGGFISVEAVAAAVAISMFLSWPISMDWLRRTAGMKIRPFMINGFRILIVGVIATALVMAIPLDQMIHIRVLLMLTQMLLAVVFNFVITALSKQGREDLVSAWYSLRKMAGRA